MGASDNIQQGRSTFLEELSEASNILNKCTSRSLVIMDELGRGTSTHDGVAIAYATLHYVLNQKKSMVLFVTHYPKIAEIQKEFPGAVGTYHVSYLTVEKKNSSPKSDLNGDKMDHEDVTYLYKLVPGISQRSFGFKVAKLAQVRHCSSFSIIPLSFPSEGRLIKQRCQNFNLDNILLVSCSFHHYVFSEQLRWLRS